MTWNVREFDYRRPVGTLFQFHAGTHDKACKLYIQYIFAVLVISNNSILHLSVPRWPQDYVMWTVHLWVRSYHKKTELFYKPTCLGCVNCVLLIDDYFERYIFCYECIFLLEVHQLLANNRYRPIIGQFADNRYRPFDIRHPPIICLSKQNNKKCF